MGGVLGDHVVGAVIGSWPIKVELFETRRPQKNAQADAVQFGYDLRH